MSGYKEYGYDATISGYMSGVIRAKSRGEATAAIKDEYGGWAGDFDIDELNVDVAKAYPTGFIKHNGIRIDIDLKE